MTKFKCPMCDSKYIKVDDLYGHIEKEHSDGIPEDYSVPQYYFFIRTGKKHGNCIICKNPTEWNEITHKYHRFCTNEKCKDRYRDEFKKRMIGKYGKISLLNDPNQQRKMLSNRKISGTYKWSDGTEKSYTGTYELDFLRFLDVFMNFESSDVMTPSPHTYYYMYNNEKKFYFPDVFIPSLNLEIEIKDGGDNPNKHTHMEVDREKERLKDNVMKSIKEFDYIKIVNKNYETFLNYLLSEKKKYIDNVEKSKLTESIISPTELEEYVDVLYEANFKHGDADLFYDFEKFSNGENNILLVTGLTGSGKSTLAKKYCSKFNAEYIALDIFTDYESLLCLTGIADYNELDNPNGNEDISIDAINLIKKNHYKDLKKIYKEANPNEPTKLSEINNHYNHKEFEKLTYNIIVSFLTKLNPKKKYIIEGIQLCTINNLFDKIKDYSLVILETSAVTSFKRHMKKELEPKIFRDKLEYLKRGIVDNRLSILSKYKDLSVSLNNLIEKMNKYKSNIDNISYSKDKYPIYIVLMHSGTGLSTYIQKVTGDAYSHVAIGFDSDLISLYSFGCKEFAPHLTAKMGLVREDLDDEFYKGENTYALYVLFVGKEEYTKIKSQLYTTFMNNKNLSFNSSGLIKYALKIDQPTKNKLFCSEFVTTLLNSYKERVFNKPHMVKPMDISYIDDIHFISNGKLVDYDSKVTNDKVNKLIKKLEG